MRCGLSVLASFAVVTSALAVPTVESRFNGTNEIDGWTTLRVDTTTLSPVGLPGLPGWEAGHLKASEVSGGLFLLSAPAKFLGAKSDYFGGSVSYLLSDETADAGATLGFFLVKSDLSIALGYRQSPPATTATAFSVPLKADGNWFRYNGAAVPSIATDADIQSALSSLGFMGVNADWTTATTDVTTLDDFVLAPVPEPGMFAALGLSALAFASRRRTRSSR